MEGLLCDPALPVDSLLIVCSRTSGEEVAEIDPAIPVHTLRTLQGQVAQSLRRERLLSAMTTAFGVLSTLLAVVGLYGVMAYGVSRRTREIGVRLA